MKLPREIKIYGEIIIVVLGVYFIIVSVAPSSTELLLWIIASTTLLLIPIFIHGEKNRRIMKKESKIIVRNDIAHFRKTVEKAINGNPVAQRDVELELLHILYIDLGIRYSLSDKEIRERMGNEEFMRKYLGEKWKIIKDVYDRKHELRKSVPRDEFIRDVNAFMEVMK